MLLLRAEGLAIEVSPTGGSVASAHFEGTPFLRSFAANSEQDFAIGDAACFPLVPFGNRIAGNGFSLGGTDYRFQRNTAGDPLYLHGDGWLAEWMVVHQNYTGVTLRYEHPADAGSPYAYEATQTIAIAAGAMQIEIGVTNRGGDPLPFGLGLHPFFPRTPNTRLTATAEAFWSEGDGHLPLRREPIPAALDFRNGSSLPQRWVNNAFENWMGRAAIVWPEHHLAVDIAADPTFRHSMLYMPDDDDSFFCFEPMSHLPNGHHLAGLGGLSMLSPGEAMTGTMTIRPRRLAGNRETNA